MGPNEQKRARRLVKRGLLETGARARGNSLTKFWRTYSLSPNGEAFLEEQT